MEALLLQAIHANPADELARQALADWLDEQGDPRGEVLRLHLDLRLRPESVERAAWKARLLHLRTSSGASLGSARSILF